MSEFLTGQMLETDGRPGSLERIYGFGRRWVVAGLLRWRRRRMAQTLNALDDWTLRDIGISRADIPRIVDGFDRRELRMAPFSDWK